MGTPSGSRIERTTGLGRGGGQSQLSRIQRLETARAICLVFEEAEGPGLALKCLSRVSALLWEGYVCPTAVRVHEPDTLMGMRSPFLRGSSKGSCLPEEMSFLYLSQAFVQGAVVAPDGHRAGRWWSPGNLKAPVWEWLSWENHHRQG